MGGSLSWYVEQLRGISRCKAHRRRLGRDKVKGILPEIQSSFRLKDVFANAWHPNRKCNHSAGCVFSSGLKAPRVLWQHHCSTLRPELKTKPAHARETLRSFFFEVKGKQKKQVFKRVRTTIPSTESQVHKISGLLTPGAGMLAAPVCRQTVG